MSILLNGDCLEELKDLDDKSIDLIFCDLPYNQTSCAWDKAIINLDKLWIEFMRIKKLNTPIVMTCTTKFGVSLINSAPKKCPFRYDLIWCKSAGSGFLCSGKMPLRKHEMVYVFYEKIPFYDLSSHKHKFIKEEIKYKDSIIDNIIDGPTYNTKNRKKPITRELPNKYSPPLPTSLIKEVIVDKEEDNMMCKDFTPNINGNIYDCPDNQEFKGRNGQPRYEPPLPTSLLEIKSTRGKHSTEKPVQLMEWILKYYSKENDTILDPTMGSGSMGVACKNMNRNFIGIEKDPEIYEGAVNRVEN